MNDDTTIRILAVLNLARPLVAMLPPAAALAVTAAISALELLLADPEPEDRQNVVTKRSDLAGLAAHER